MTGQEQAAADWDEGYTEGIRDGQSGGAGDIPAGKPEVWQAGWREGFRKGSAQFRLHGGAGM